jgi:hypothetical protein
MESLIALSEAEAKWRCDAHGRAKRVEALARVSRSTPATYDCLNGVNRSSRDPRLRRTETAVEFFPEGLGR